MALPSAALVSIVLLALIVALSMAHVAHGSPARPDSHNPAVVVPRMQRMIRRYALLLGLVETAALVALVVALVPAPRAGAQLWLDVLAALCVTAVAVVGIGWLRPLQSTVVRWQANGVPADWSTTHRRWLAIHRLEIVLAIIALTFLLMSLAAVPAA